MCQSPAVQPQIALNVSSPIRRTHTTDPLQSSCLAKDQWQLSEWPCPSALRSNRLVIGPNVAVKLSQLNVNLLSDFFSKPLKVPPGI